MLVSLPRPLSALKERLQQVGGVMALFSSKSSQSPDVPESEVQPEPPFFGLPWQKSEGAGVRLVLKFPSGEGTRQVCQEILEITLPLAGNDPQYAYMPPMGQPMIVLMPPAIEKLERATQSDPESVQSAAQRAQDIVAQAEIIFPELGMAGYKLPVTGPDVGGSPIL